MSETSGETPESNAEKPSETKECSNELPPTSEEQENTTSRSEGSANARKSLSGTKFKEQFKAFSKFGDTKSDGKHLTLSQSDKWMKQAKVIDGKKITTTDTGIHFKKFKSLKISFEDYKKFIENLAEAKKVDLTEIENKLSSCGAPALRGVALNSKIDSTVERLTDVSKYTGSHKQRFDDTGKGKGIAGRKDIVDNSGYVSGYQNKDTYSKTH